MASVKSKDSYEANYKALSDDDFAPLSQRQLDRSTITPPRNGQKSATTEGSLSYDKK